jgi:pimeloyl-ACP methyl ester carboxylesterase
MQTVHSADGTRIAFDRSGSGPVLILVGGASSTRAAGADLAAALAPDFTVLAYDRRGRGDSGDTAPYAVEREVDDIEALIDGAGGSASLFGHSSGAVLSLEAGRRLAGKIKKLALYEPPFIIDDSRPPAPPDFSAQLNALVAAGRRGDAVELFQRVVGLSPEMIAQARQSPMWPALEAGAHTLAYDAAIVEDAEQGTATPLKKYAAVSIPTLVLDGTLFLGSEEKHAWMRRSADELVRVLPDARRRTLERQDHGAAADELAAVLLEFFVDAP